jgi:hypothetical protein
VLSLILSSIALDILRAATSCICCASCIYNILLSDILRLQHPAHLACQKVACCPAGISRAWVIAYPQKKSMVNLASDVQRPASSCSCTHSIQHPGCVPMTGWRNNGSHTCAPSFTNRTVVQPRGQVVSAPSLCVLAYIGCTATGLDRRSLSNVAILTPRVCMQCLAIRFLWLTGDRWFHQRPLGGFGFVLL